MLFQLVQTKEYRAALDTPGHFFYKERKVRKRWELMTLMTIMTTIMTSIKSKTKDICRLPILSYIFSTPCLYLHQYKVRSKQTAHGMCGPSDKAVFFFFLTSGDLARRLFFFIFLRYATTTTTTKHSRPFLGGTKKERKNPYNPFSLSSSFL